LYIQVDNRCNANCNFCEYHGSSRSFNISKLGYIIKYLSDICLIGKLNFTGGEPTIDLSKFDEIVECTKENINFVKKPEVTLNTNGIHLMETLKYADYLDSIGLSRHHYLDEKNNEIFNSDSVATAEMIKEYQSKVSNKHLVQLRCNVITGYVDNAKEVEAYLTHAIAIGAYDCGFVTLMPINKYCLEHQVDFYSMLNGISNILKVNGFSRYEDGEKVCECGNYVYSDNKGNFCKFYNRYFSHSDLRAGQLVYDGEYLRYGFGGEIIY
jgi:molybdenum cofactor biosynthesis enzyme MoaA